MTHDDDDGRRNKKKSFRDIARMGKMQKCNDSFYGFTLNSIENKLIIWMIIVNDWSAHTAQLRFIIFFCCCFSNLLMCGNPKKNCFMAFDI